MQKRLFNDNFQCKTLAYDSSYLNIEFGMNADLYESVELPHDALIHDANNFYTDHVIWYRKQIGQLPSPGKRLILYFEGVYMEASFYINEQFVGKEVNGYTSFYFDITDYVKAPTDYLYVCIDYRCPNSRWYAGPGINRNVWLYEADENHLKINSLYVCPKKNNDGWSVNISVEAQNDKLLDLPDIVFNCEELGISDLPLKKTELDNYIACVDIDAPKLWDIDNPYIYNCSASMIVDGDITDTIESRFGFRDVVMSTTEGLFLNGRHIKINGVCLHSDQGCLGTAFYEDMARHQLNLMKSMGVNSIRLTHNIQAPGFLDLCDELGLLVLDEAFDCWKRPKTSYDYARFFEEWSKRDIKNWIMRDRNHPSVFLWSAGNEIYDTHAGEDGAQTLQYINKEIRKNDFFEHAPVTLCSNYMAWDNTINAVDFLKLAGYNYGEFLYEKHHEEHPDWIIFGSETASTVQSRGIYHFPLSQSLLVDDDEHCSSLGNSCTSWGAKSMDFCITTERDTDYSLGQYLWSGIDYLGEPTPYHTKSSYFGAVDTACFPKDVYYLLQSCWRSFEECPMIHILPYWDFNNGQIIDVRICSNAASVELFFNDLSLGKKVINHASDMCLYADYQLPYSEGVLKAVGYDTDGKAVVEAVERSFTDSASLKLNIESFSCEEGDTHLRFVEIQAIDSEGNYVRNACDRIKVSVSGPGKLIGLCNGNQTDMDSFKGDSMRLFSGKLLAVVKATGEAGDVLINADIDKDDIPVRKLNIVADNSKPLSPSMDSVTARVEIMPEGARYDYIEYQITNEYGVPIQNAIIDSSDSSFVTVKAVADARFNLRALCHESDGRVTVISSLGFVAEGFGELLKNPYGFVSASLYDDCRSEIGNGNEKGVATSRTEDSYLLYNRLNFGDLGSKKVTIPIFELGNEDIPISFWNGMPHAEGSRLIGSGVYRKPSIWNVYQEESFELDELLTGIQSFAIETFKQKIHIKGFQFDEYNRSFETLQIKNADNIYGDQYTVTEDLVAGIGNNVCIEYKNMDFGKLGASRIHVTGHTPLDHNTIHVRFNDGVNENRQIIEFANSDGLTKQSFDLEPITGEGTLTFVFLPGSDFDFKEFRFE